MSTRSVEQHLGDFLDEWQATTVMVQERAGHGDSSFLKDISILEVMDHANCVSKAGYAHLNAAADALLMRERLAAKLTRSTARKALLKGLKDHLPKALKTRRLSEHAIIAKAKVNLAAHPRDDGLYFFPLVFAYGAKETDFRVGVARIVARPVLEAELADAWARHDERDNDFSKRLSEDWKNHSQSFDHYIVVEVNEHEEKMAWVAARDAAECLFNLIRMLFGYDVMDDVRIGDGFIWPETQSTLRLTHDGFICLSTSFGGGVSHLRDDWVEPFDSYLRHFSRLLADVVTWHTVKDGQPDALLERLTYFDRLIAEAYSEPYHPIRLVRLVAALEALTVINATDKAHNLAHRCGCTGGNGDPARYCEIYDAVREAYRWRNAVVHGDAPSHDDVMRAFRGLERHLLNIYLGLLSLHAGIANAVRPRSIKALRREVAARVDMFFWSPSLAVWNDYDK
jgi:hypothetical protein